jgi:hypothetical protein
MTRVLIHRTITPNSPPTDLQVGELGIEMDTPTRLWVGVPAAQNPAQKKLLYDSSAGAALVTIGDTPPTPASPGMLWWESDSGKLYVYYDDGTSQQWVTAAPAGVNGTPGGTLLTKTRAIDRTAITVNGTLFGSTPATPQTEGVAVLQQSITVKSATSRLTVRGGVWAYHASNGGVGLQLFTTATDPTYVVGAATGSNAAAFRSTLIAVSEDILHGKAPGTVITATMRAAPVNTNYPVINHATYGFNRTTSWIELEELA